MLLAGIRSINRQEKQGIDADILNDISKRLWY
ncbi:MAG: hypothetical protein ACI89T_002039 [Cognaticolwellia sp.]|jgi:hypothetical protein